MIDETSTYLRLSNRFWKKSPSFSISHPEQSFILDMGLEIFPFLLTWKLQTRTSRVHINRLIYNWILTEAIVKLLTWIELSAVLKMIGRLVSSVTVSWVPLANWSLNDSGHRNESNEEREWEAPSSSHLPNFSWLCRELLIMQIVLIVRVHVCSLYYVIMLFVLLIQHLFWIIYRQKCICHVYFHKNLAVCFILSLVGTVNLSFGCIICNCRFHTENKRSTQKLRITSYLRALSLWMSTPKSLSESRISLTQIHHCGAVWKSFKLHLIYR